MGGVVHDVTSHPRRGVPVAPVPPLTPSPRPRLAWLRNAVVLTVLACLGGLLAGGWYGARLAAVHEATAVVLISPLDGNPFSPDGPGSNLVNLETEAQLVRSDTVASDVVTDLELEVPVAQLLDEITVEVPPNTQIVRITASHRSATEALARAQSFADSYLEFRQARARAASGALADQVAGQIADRQQDLAKKSRQLPKQDPASPNAVLLRQQIVDGTTQLGELKAQLAALQSARPDPGEVVTPAAIPAPGTVGPRELMGGLGLLVALVASLAVAGVRARRDDRVRSVADLDDVGVPVLGELTDEGDGDDLASAGVRSAILAALPQRPLTVALASTDRDVLVADALSRSMARARHEVVLVDVTSGSREREGLSDLVLDRASPDDALVPVTSHLSHLAPGRTPERLPDLLGSPDMAATLDELGKRADVVVLDAGSVSDAPCQALVRHTHGVVLEVHSGTTDLRDIAAARALVWSAGGQVVGVVLVHRGRGQR